MEGSGNAEVHQQWGLFVRRLTLSITSLLVILFFFLWNTFEGEKIPFVVAWLFAGSLATLVLFTTFQLERLHLVLNNLQFYHYILWVLLGPLSTLLGCMALSVWGNPVPRNHTTNPVVIGVCATWAEFFIIASACIIGLKEPSLRNHFMLWLVVGMLGHIVSQFAQQLRKGSCRCSQDLVKSEALWHHPFLLLIGPLGYLLRLLTGSYTRLKSCGY